MSEHPIRAIRRAGVPLAAFETADPALTVTGCNRALNGKQDTTPLLAWDVCRGIYGLNKLGQATCQDLGAEPMTTSNPTESLTKLLQAPAETICFWHNAQNYLSDPTVKQAIWNIRDEFKGKHATLIMLAPVLVLPDELKHDCVVVSEPLPDAEEIKRIIASTVEDAVSSGMPAIDEATTNKAADALLGLSAFAAEQALSMSVTKEGLSLESILERRRSFIGQTNGMEIRTDKITFADIAGYETVKTALKRKINGKRPPRLVLWLDEAEKAFAGNAGDMSGTTQDQIGTLLTWFQDRLNADQLSAMLLVGFPGTGKSAIAMAAHNEAQCESVRLDMGAMKGSLVGESERKIRQVLKTIDALCSGHILCLSTCNSIANLPSPFISRHAFGCYMFDLPTEAENKALWKLKRAKYDISAKEELPDSRGWTGREIQQCCFLASDMSIPLIEAAKYIAPFFRSGAREVESLRTQANGRWISASTEGLYQLPIDKPSRSFSL